MLQRVSAIAALVSLAALAACSSPSPVSDVGTKGNVFYLAERHAGALVTLVAVGSDSCREFQQEGETCSLLVLCGNGILSVFIQTDEFQNSGVVTYRIEQQRSITETWQFQNWDSESQRVALYSPAPKKLFEELRGASRFSIQTSATPELSFDVTDLFDTPIQPNLDNCGLDGWR